LLATVFVHNVLKHNFVTEFEEISNPTAVVQGCKTIFFIINFIDTKYRLSQQWCT